MKRLLSLMLCAVLAVSLIGYAAPQPAPTAAPSTEASPTAAPTQEPTTEPTAEPTAAPTEPPQEDPVAIRVGGMKGPTSIGMIKLMHDAEEGAAANDYAFTIVGAADELTPKLISGELDMAAIPSNLASVLYNNTQGQITLLAVNTLGVVYIVEKGETVSTVEDLRGKTIYATGKGSIPEYALRYILSGNGIDPDKDVTIEWKSEAAEVVSVLSSDSEAVAMLPQPYVTVAQTQVEGLRIAIDLTQAWDALGTGSQLITGVMVARTDFITEHPQAIEAFLTEYAASIDYVNANVDEAAKMVEDFDIYKAPIAKKAIPYCNVRYLEGADMKAALAPFYQVLLDQNPKAIGGALPDDAFYYEK